MGNGNFLVVLLVTVLYISNASSDLLDLQVRLLKENYTGRAHTFFKRVTRKLYLDDLQSVGTSGPRVNRFPPSPIIVRNVNDTSGVLHFTKIIKQFGYVGEEHQVTTPDGYILGIHRITSGPKTPKAKGKPVVFFQHGLFASSDCFVLMGPSSDLAYILVDAGYDVWLNNVRGNTYSRNHVTLLPNYDLQFWQHSYHEMGIFDVPTAIDYILETTGQEKLIYIGHSMGTTICYILLSQLPQYNEKMRLVISLSPVAYWHAAEAPAAQLLKDNKEALTTYFHAAKVYELFPLSKLNNFVSNNLCTGKSFIKYYCLRIFAFLFGPNRLHLDTISNAFQYFPAGSSRQTVENYFQNAFTGDFQPYDLGSKENLRKFGQEKPPHYKISNIVAPVALYYSNGDALITPKDVITLSEKLPNVITLEQVGDDKFNHVDFLFANDIVESLQEPILKLIKNFLGDKIDI